MLFKRVGTFVLGTLLITWLFIFLLFQFTVDGAVNPYVYGLGMFIPMLVALVVQRVIHKEPFRKPLGIVFRNNRWFWISPVFAIIFCFTALAVTMLFPQAVFYPQLDPSVLADISGTTTEELPEVPAAVIWASTILGALVMGFTINGLFALGEEVGWRGFLHKELAPLGFWKASFLIGLIWGIWHAPFILLLGHNYPDQRWTGVALFTLICITVSPLYTFLRLKSGTVLSAAAFHGAYNAVAQNIMISIGGVGLLIGGPIGIAGVITGLLSMAIIYAYEKKAGQFSLKIDT